ELAYDQSYSVSFNDVADAAGNAASIDSLVFSTPALVATAVPVTLEATSVGAPCALVGGDARSPGHCAGGAAGDDPYHPFTPAAHQDLELRFSQPLRPSSVELGATCGAGDVRVEELDDGGDCVEAVAGTLFRHDRTIRFAPDLPWRDG